MTPDLPYQAIGAEWLAERKRALLGDEPGVGKTLQAIRACDLVFAVNVLIVAPASVVDNWRGEIERFRIGDWTATIVSYEGMAKLDPNARYDVAIFDEGQYLRTPTAKRTRLAYGDTINLIAEFEGIVARSDYVWTLSGTFQMNFPNEWYTHFRALAPERILSPKTGKVWTFEQFQSHFCEMTYGFAGMKVVGSKNEDKLQKRLDGFMLRRLKKDVLPDLPDVRFSEFDVKADVTDIELGINPEEIKALKIILERDGVAGLKDAYSYFASVRRATALAKVKAVAEYLRMFLETTDRKIVVFAHHVDVIKALRKQRGMEGFVHIDGSTHPRERSRMVERFQTEPNIRGFFGQIVAAGTGITLTAASDLLFVESSWVPAENAQAAMRIHRIGQKSLCDVRFAVLPKSIDAIVTRAVMRKSESIAKVLGEER